MAALDEALLLVDAHQRAYDIATESQRRLLNLAIFEHFTIVEEADEIIIEPQLEAFYEQLMDCAELRPTNGHGPESGRQTAGPALRRPAALAAPTGARNRPLRDANPSPIAWGRGSHNEHLAEGVGFEPTVGGLPLQRFSRPPDSTTLAPLQGASGERLPRIAVARRAGGRAGGPRQRREPKKSVSSAAHSAASRPPATCGWWFSRGSASTSSTEPAAPALGSVVP